MTQRKKTDAETIGDAHRQIGLLMSGKTYEPKLIQSCIAKFRTIAENGEGLKSHFPDLMRAIDAAILQFYPHVGPWDDKHRSELLLKYVSIMDRIMNSDPVEREEMKKVMDLCEAVQKGFEDFHEILARKRA